MSDERHQAHERANFDMLGQITGLVAVLSAMIDTMPRDTLIAFRKGLDKEFEPLLAMMLADPASDADPSREGVEAVREAFLEKVDARLKLLDDA